LYAFRLLKFLKATKRSESVQVIVVIAAGVLCHTGTLYKKSYFVLVCHANSAVHLDGFAGSSLGNLTQFGLGSAGK
jgi:hypothetical protein